MATPSNGGSITLEGRIVKAFILIFIICCGTNQSLTGCTNSGKAAYKKELAIMTDEELISRYQMLEMRMIDIDRDRERSLEQEQTTFNVHSPGADANHLGHLHIGDRWNALNEEKRLVHDEMRKRCISP